MPNKREVEKEKRDKRETKMGLNGKIIMNLGLVVVLVVLAGAIRGLAEDDPRLQDCKHQCKHLRPSSERLRKQCKHYCEDYYNHKDDDSVDPAYRHCRERCQEEHLGRGEQQVCEAQCQMGWGSPLEAEGMEVGEGEGEGERNPYVFREEHYKTRYESQEGRLMVLQRFNKRSPLLRGIENYRVVIFEANPHTFILPNQWDADSVFFVDQGSGTITLVYPDRRETFNIERGHIMRVPAGVSFYAINRHETQKLVLVNIVRPVSIPGKFQAFFEGGGLKPETILNAFSPEVLEAAYNVTREKLLVFTKHVEGPVVKANREQIRALSGGESIWPFGGRSSGPFKLLKRRQRSSVSNDHGKLYEVGFDDYDQLQDLDISISFANITRGSMTLPFYYSTAISVAVITGGRGCLQMACPHVSSSPPSPPGSRTSKSVHYERISSELSRGMVYVVPPGHPFVTLASQDENLEIVCFKINARNNQRIPLAGNMGIMKQWEKEAKELAYSSREEEVDQVLYPQSNDLFARGPMQDQCRGFASF